jgi:hypothetical protein
MFSSLVEELRYAARRGFGRSGAAGVKVLRRDPERMKIAVFGSFLALWVEAP